MKTVQKILVPVDFSEQSAHGLRYAASLARELKAELIVLHVFDKYERYSFIDSLAVFEGWPMSSRDLVRIPVDIWLREKALDLYNFIDKTLRNPAQLKIKRRVRIGELVKEVLNVAQEEKIDLIVVKTEKKSIFSYLTGGGKFFRLIWKFPYPVLLTPPRQHDGRERRGPLIFLPILRGL